MRYKFIDLAKGICILLVIMIHVGVPEYMPGLYAAKVPIFFVLAGLFFLKSVNGGGYFRKKIYSLLVPFLTFYIISYSIFYILEYLLSINITNGLRFSITDVIHQRNLFNGPLWFLLCLFEVEVLFWALWKFIKNESLKAIIVLAIATVGFTLAHFEIFLPAWLDTACVAALYFYLGILLSKSKYIYATIKPQWLMVGACMLYLIFILFPVVINMSTNHYSNPILAVISGTAIVGCILCICKLVDDIGIITWIGTNSLVLLCTHHLIYRPIKYLQIYLGYESSLLLFALTMIVEIPVVILINRYFPLLTGQWRKKTLCVQRT